MSVLETIIAAGFFLFSLLTPYRWRKMPKLVTDILLIVSTALLTMGIEPYWGPFILGQTHALEQQRDTGGTFESLRRELQACLDRQGTIDLGKKLRD